MGCASTKDQGDGEDYYKTSIEEARISRPSRFTGGGFSDENFTQSQKEIIRTTWCLINSSPEVRMERGIQIFLRIFQARPETKGLFSFRHLEGNALLQNSLFKGHASRFLNAVDVTVQNLDALDLICAPTLVTLGKTHIRFVGFKPEYMAVFVEAIDQVWADALGSVYADNKKEAWHRLFHYISSKILQGYQEASCHNPPTSRYGNVLQHDVHKVAPASTSADESDSLSQLSDKNIHAMHLEDRPNERLRQESNGKTADGVAPGVIQSNGHAG